MMNDDAPASIGDVPAMSKAVAESLSALSEVVDDQSRAIASLSEDIMAAMIALVREAEQQLYVVGQAALTQGIALLYSVVAAATGKVEAAELKLLLDAIGAPKPRQ